MADEPKNPERYYKRERVYFQHPAVKDMPRLTDALRDTDKEGNVNLHAKDYLEAEASKGPDDETHYGRIRRLNREWNEAHPVFREHRVELTPWEEKPYNERALHHVQFHIPNGGGAMSLKDPADELIVRTHAVKNDDDTISHYSKLEQVPEGWGMVEAVGHALGDTEGGIRHKLYSHDEGQYPKEFGPGTMEHRRQVMKEHGYRDAKMTGHEDPDPFRKEKRN